MKLYSWNVNGIRACIKKGFEGFVADHNPDIVCLQETKAQPEQVDMHLPEHPYQYWNWAEKKGYSGTAIFSKTKPLRVTRGIGIAQHDTEGRVLTAEFPNFYLVNVYTPNSQNELLRLDYRTQSWDVDFLDYCKEIEKTKPVLICGDLNVAHKEIDLKNPKTNTKNAGFTPEERARFDCIIEAGFVDTFREFEKGPDFYSWWSYRANARERNVGWRIDYFLASEILKSDLQAAAIHPDVHGSDHCPVSLEIKL